MATSVLGRNQASSSSAPVQKLRYDVFVSYRGEDTGKNFTDHLYSRLNSAGISTFRDKNELKRGEKISSELFEAIHASNIFLLVFSRNYATSRWCLDELVEIMKRRKQFSRLVLPIFYKVNPSDVRKQTGSFREAFVKHDDDQKVDPNKVSSWRAALAEAGELSGWDLEATDGHEGDLIKKIVEHILSVLKHTYLHIAIHPIGIDFRMKYVNSLLRVGTNDVHAVGICGMGGIGKTTIAKAVFNHFLHSFENKSFLPNVRENSKQHEKQFLLQNQLLSDVLKTEATKVHNVDQGINVIKDRLCNRRVLLVLDDVDQLDQLTAFGCHSDSVRKDCYGPGSRIIITTRHTHLLEAIEVNSNYMVKELNDNESLKLFSLHAFNRSDPLEGYAQLSKDVVGFCNGLPLALEVLGSCLREFKSIVEWKNTLEKLRNNPHGKIQEKLKISFDALDGFEKQIFLDIACFFIGMDEYDVTQILDGCGFYATSGIGVLTRRCLLTINEGKLMMHDLLRDMGRKIVCQEPVNHPGQRSRLWHCETAFNVVRNCRVTDQIEGLALNMDGPINVVLGDEAFARMQNLRLLQLNYVSISGDYEHLSKELRWLCWHGFPLNSIPKKFNQVKLVALDMQYSNLKQVWKDNKVLENLKFLNLSHSHFLTIITTDFSTLPNLMELILEDCRGLKRIDESIGSLNKLWLLNLKNCANLRNLPKSICMVKSLAILVLDGCLKLDKLQEEIGEMKSLTGLCAGRTAIQQLPDSIVHLKNLQYLYLAGSEGSPPKSWLSFFSSWVSLNRIPDSKSLFPNSLLGLTSLTRLSLQDCNLSEGAIPKDTGNLSSLEFLDLGGNNFYSLPASISRLCNLETLWLYGCTKLTSLPELPSSLGFLGAPNIPLERLPDLSNFSHSPTIFLNNCNRLAKFPFTENLLQKWYGRYKGDEFDDAVFPWSEIPDWFRNQRMGNVLSFQVPPDMSMLKGFVLCIMYAPHDFNFGVEAINYFVDVSNVTKDVCVSCHRYGSYGPSPTAFDHLTLGYVPLQKFEVDSGDEVKIEIDLCCELIVKMCGVIPVYIEAKKRTKMYIQEEEEVNELNSWSGNESVMVVHDQGRQHQGNKGKTKCDNDNEEEAGPSRVGDKGKRKCSDEAVGPSHYWSYEADDGEDNDGHEIMICDEGNHNNGNESICDEDNDNKDDPIADNDPYCINWLVKIIDAMSGCLRFGI